MSKERYIFNILRSEYSKYSTAGITLDEDLCKSYSQEIIERAKLLKAKNISKQHKDNFTDGYYLDYAKSLCLKDVIGALKEIHKNRLAGVEITDINWAVYSYEEIIEMENNGVEIPDEVLQWAHAQQEADVTDYVILSDGTLTDNDTTAITDNDLSQLNNRVKQNIVKVDTAQKETEQKVQKYQQTAEKAEDIKKQKEDTYEDSMKEITDLTSEWKKLDDKRKNGRLSRSEQKRFNDLGKMLNGSNGTLMKEIQADAADLDEFLNTLDDLNKGINDNLVIAKEAIDSGIELSNYNKQYSQSDLPAVNPGAKSGNGLLDEVVSALQGDEIAEAAVDKGNELKNYSNSIKSELETSENVALETFATDYTNLETQTENNTKNAMGDDFEKASKDEKEKNEKKDEFNVDIKFTYQNAQKATVTTIKSTVDLIAKQAVVNASDSSLQKELKNTEKDIKKLTKETAKATKKQEENTGKEEIFLQELEAIQTSSKNDAKPVTTKEVVEANSKNEKAEKPSQETQSPEAAAAQGKKEAIVDNIKSIEDENSQIQGGVKKVLAKGIASTAKSQKISTELTKENSELAQRTKNAQDVAEKTIIVGNGTFAKSFITNIIGTAMTNSGVSMMAFPPSYYAGLALFIAGQFLIDQSQKEFKYGLIASGTGVAGLMATGLAVDTNSDAKNTLKVAAQMFKANKNVIKEAAQVSGGSDTTQVSENSTTNNNQPENTETKNNTNENPTENIDNAGTTKTDINEVMDNLEQNNESTEETEEPTETTDTPETQETDKTNETNEEDSTNKTEENENAEQPQDAENKNKSDKKYSVSLEFTAKNSKNAAETTQEATREVLTSQKVAENTTAAILSEVKKNQGIVKTVEKAAKIAQSTHQVKVSAAEVIKQQIEAEKAQVQSAQSPDEIENAQNKVAALVTNLESTGKEDENNTSEADKTIQNGVNKINNFESHASAFDDSLSDFVKLLRNQLEVSIKTTGVGIGTTGIGIWDVNDGSAMMTTGLALMSNPVTHAAGAIYFANGLLTTAQGVAEITTGTFATATGTAGIVVNANATAAEEISSATVKVAFEAYKESDKKIADAGVKVDAGKNNDDSDIQEKVEEVENAQPTEEETTTETVNNISAAASTNANVNDTTTTDDKADRKLSRFNTDSIIESKKKNKKVKAVQSIYTGRNKK